MAAQQVLLPEALPGRPDGGNGSRALMVMIEKAAFMPDFDPMKLQQLFELKMRYEADEARKAYVSAMADFKKNPPQINKNKHVEFGNTKYDHATLDHVTDTITKSLSEHGITHRWEVEQKDAKVKVTCILTHEFGHSESTTLEGPADTSGSKNPIQAIASAVTYLQRYTLLAATGLAARGTDNDGAGATVSNGDLAEQVEWILSARNLEELQKLYVNAYKIAQKSGNKNAMAAVISAKDRRKGELQ